MRSLLTLVLAWWGIWVTTATVQGAEISSSPWDDSFRVLLTRIGQVHAVLVQRDGKILIQGDFQWVGQTPRNGIARLFPDGALDDGFNPGRLLDGVPVAVAMLPDGRVLLGVRGQGNHHKLYRILPDGSLDATFDNAPGFQAEAAVENPGLVLLPLAGDQTLVGGFFQRFGETPRRGLARLLPSGSLDMNFDAGTAMDSATGIVGLSVDRDAGYLAATRLQSGEEGFLRLRANGEAVVGTPFSREERQRVQLPVLADGRRVSVEGTTLTIYTRTGAVQTRWRDTPAWRAPNGRHYAAQHKDGGLLVTGTGPDLENGQANFGLVKLRRRGRPDPGFIMPGGVSLPNSGIDRILNYPDGRLLVTGGFFLANGIRAERMVRVNSDGSVDPTFPSQAFEVSNSSFAVADDGTLFGDGTRCPGVIQDCDYGIVRWNADGIRDESFFGELYCESIVETVWHPRAGILFTTQPGGPCSFSDWYFLLRRADVANGGVDPNFEISVLSRNEFGFTTSGSIRHILPHPSNDTTYVIGHFNYLDENHVNGIARLRSDGTPDPEFQFTQPELLSKDIPSSSPFAANVEADGSLTLFASLWDYGRIVTLRPDGAVARNVLVPFELPLFDSGTWRYRDGSWLVTSQTIADPRMVLQRIGSDGRLLARQSIPLLEGGEDLPTALDQNEGLVVGGGMLPCGDEVWSGLLRIDQAALSPVSLRLEMTPEGRWVIVQGPPDRDIQLETSTDLTVWNPWKTLSLNSDGAAEEPMVQATSSRIFIRAVWSD